MFESAELGQSIPDAEYAKLEPKLRADLLDAQYALLQSKAFPMIILVNGVDGAGKGETVNLLTEWMDPRHIQSHAFGAKLPEELGRPEMWRFWRALPPKGKIGVLFGNWYTSPIVDRVQGRTKDATLAADLVRVRRFEKLLTDDGAVLVKLWFHLSKSAQRKRLKELESSARTRWRVTPNDWKAFKSYSKYAKISERVLRETSTGEAPWIVIEGTDPNYRSITAGRTVLAALRARLEAAAGASAHASKRAAKSNHTIIRTVDTSKILKDLPFVERLSKAKYTKQIEVLQGQLNLLSRSPKMKKHAVVVVMEGMDAAGKGGAIRRITQALDARVYDIVPIAAPTEEERAQPYLWRFWRHLPRHGRFLIFDRSWYGRVLVERVEGFAPPDAWMRAYNEINDFEVQLQEAGIVLVKLWLAVTKDEQLKRFKEREATKFKQFKITPDDWRNRKKWDDYVAAAGDMIDRTSTAIAPWKIVEANDKHLARVRVIETIIGRMKEAF